MGPGVQNLDEKGGTIGLKVQKNSKELDHLVQSYGIIKAVLPIYIYTYMLLMFISADLMKTFKTDDSSVNKQAHTRGLLYPSSTKYNRQVGLLLELLRHKPIHRKRINFHTRRRDRSLEGEDEGGPIPSATEVSEVGILFKRSRTGSMKEISFQGSGFLIFPPIVLRECQRCQPSSFMWHNP